MRIVVVGVNHTTAPLDVRERLTVPAGELDVALGRLQSVVREGLVVSTCNRTEVYGLVGHESSGAETLLRFLADQGRVDLSVVQSASYVRAHGEAVRHLLRVTSGLDSMVLGEDQIQAQVKRAIACARDAGMLGATLERLGSAALACGKRVRTFTGVGRHAVSLESLAVHAAAERLGHLRAQRALVVGAGESALLVARLLESGGADAGSITIVGRSHARARARARRIGAEARPWSELPEALVEADAVFSCTSAPRAVITSVVLARRIAARGRAALLCIDLGMPRDVDASVASIPGISILTLDALAKMADAHRAARREHVPAAEAIVNAEAERFLAWLDARSVALAITALNAHADAVVKHELERALPGLQSLSSEQRAVVTELAHRIVRKLTHAPVNALKHHPDADNMALVLEFLFGVPGAADVVEHNLPRMRGAQDTVVSTGESAS
jgi:glutamyl-tRNA reductase